MRVEKVRALTGIRFAFAALVVIYHIFSNEAVAAYFGIRGLPLGIGNIFGVGYIGVQFFFVLSGFILTYNYHDIKPEETKKFLIARFARIYPLLVFAFAIALPGIIMNAFRTHDGLGAIRELTIITVLSLLVLQAFVPQYTMTGNGPAWSLSNESFFYALFPRTMRYLRNLSTSHLLLLAVLMFVASQGVAYWGFCQFAEVHVSATEVRHFEIVGYFIAYFPVFRFPEFFIGMVFGILYKRNSRLLKYHMPIFLGSVAFILVVICRFANLIPFTMMSSGLFAFPTAGIFLSLTQPSMFSKLLSNAWLELLGDASYSLYLLHEWLLAYLRNFDRHFLGIMQKYPLGGILLSCSIVLICAVLSYKFIEIPCRRWIMNYAKKRGVVSDFKSDLSPNQPPVI